IAIGNAPPGNPELVAAALRCLDDASPLVRAAAVWALARLTPAECAAERSTRLAKEEDAVVRAEWEQAPLDTADGLGDQPIDDGGESVARAAPPASACSKTASWRCALVPRARISRACDTSLTQPK